MFRFFTVLLLAVIIFQFSTNTSAQSIKKQRTKCNDHRDNDRDGLIDYPKDPGCKNRKDNSEKNKASIQDPNGLSVHPSKAFRD